MCWLGASGFARVACVAWLCRVRILLSLMACHVVLSMVEFDRVDGWFLLDGGRELIAIRCGCRRVTVNGAQHI